ncbi:MAG: ComF family protein [Sphingomonadaceae bacterium]
MRNLFEYVVSFALPPRCSGCGQIVSADFQFCADCWQSLELLSGRGCEQCGAPVPLEIAICGPCLQAPPDHDGAYAVAAYGPLARTIALKLKHGRKVGLARLIARLLFARMPAEDGILIPVPAHRWRMFGRGFNQSALIARHLSRSSGLPVFLDALHRDRSTQMLRGASARERARIVRGAFSIDRKFLPQLAGKTIFLVDDVYTSGATANACARTLKRSGARKVIILCWARVVLDSAAD